MRNYKKKHETIEAYPFNEVIEHGIAILKANNEELHDGMPWSFEFFDAALSHETDDDYIIVSENFNDRIKPNSFVIVQEDIVLDVVTFEELQKDYEIIPTTFKDRLHKELFELEDKITKLTNFTTTVAFVSLDRADQTLLNIQLKHMKDYRDILVIRVDLSLRE